MTDVITAVLWIVGSAFAAVDAAGADCPKLREEGPTIKSKEKHKSEGQRRMNINVFLRDTGTSGRARF